MPHLSHLKKNKRILAFRHDLVKIIREFFWSKGFDDVETPLLVRLPGQEPNLSPMAVTLHDEYGTAYRGYLHTSPEYAMKKMLAAGFGNIFSITKCFRDQESFGGLHNPEFTMIEWYRAGKHMNAIMDDIDEMLALIYNALGRTYPEYMQSAPQTPRRIHMRHAWREYTGTDLDAYIDRKNLFELCKKRGYRTNEHESYEDLFYRIFLHEIEPNLTTPTIIHHYPKAMAALAKIDPNDSAYAERFEFYINGMELANAFSELTDPDEQRQRLEHEQEKRTQNGATTYPIDEDFLRALADIPSAAGIALGIDRLVQIYTGCKDISDVIPLPASQLFKHKDI